MAKIPVIVPNNLLNIRTELGLSQNEMGEILGVSTRMICNYEIGTSNLPPDKAMILSTKFNYSFSYIYADKTKQPVNSDSFMIDIRKTITCDNDNVYFTITDNHWNYLCELLGINNSVNTNKTKINDRLELDAKYANSTESDIIWRVTIPKKEFYSYVQSDNGLLPFYEPNSNKNKHKPTKEQTENILNFFEDIQK